ncbi:MAG: lamin tail domain-containing protein [Acidobacteriota bacterium]
MRFLKTFSTLVSSLFSRASARGSSGFCALALLAALAAPLHAQHLRVYYPDIEQGSSTLVVSPTGRALLVDAGSGIQRADDRVEELINDLIATGVVTSLDFLLATHYDEDHIGRMENVLQLVPLDPAAIVYDRGEFQQVPQTFAYNDYAFSAGFQNRTTVPVCTVLDLGGGVRATVQTVNGEVCGAGSVSLEDTGQFENAASVAVLVEYQDFDLWIGGDLTGNPDFDLADVETAAGPPTADVDVYTVNHHGSRSSSNENFLGDLRAEIAINQNSASNNFGHPNAIVVERFLATPDTAGETPLFVQQNPGNASDDRSNDSLAWVIGDCDDPGSPLFADDFETGDIAEWQEPAALPGVRCNLPGTLSLLSNGTSYRLHGCGFSPRTFAADEGTGTIGAYPPAIRWVRRVPEVPAAGESVAVRAKIHGASSVSLVAEFNGVAQAPVAMSALGGNVFGAVLPGRPNGAQVAFRVRAEAAGALVEESPAQGFFSGTTPITTLRQNDADGVLVPKHFGARVTGTLTAQPGLFSDTVTLAYLQDATGGLQIFDAEVLALPRGQLVTFTGRLEQFGGQTELNVAEDCGNLGAVDEGPGTPPTPQTVTVAQIGEALEGRLVRVAGLSIVEGMIPEIDSGSLLVTDDGGVTTTQIRIDGDTDIPGSSTPTQSFDLVGIVTQFDTFAPLTSGYQITPREKLDFLTEEVNHPPVLVSEVLANPPAGGAGDANGDGLSVAAEDSFVELVNTEPAAMDISGYSLRDGGGTVRHVFAPGTVIAPREAAVVFGGGVPTGSFGNAAANGLVFTASSGGLGLEPSGDTLIFADDAGEVVQEIPFAAFPSESLVRLLDFSNAPFVAHSLAEGSGGSLFSPGTLINGQAFSVTPGSVILTEVLYDAGGADGGKEWFELYNATAHPVALRSLCVGSAGNDYTNSLVGFGDEVIGAGQTFVVGGPTSSGDNGNPVFDLVFDFSPDFQNSGSVADGVALFNLRCAQVTETTVPIDVVIYGGSNSNGLLDETGAAGPVDVGDASSGQSIERVGIGGGWQINPSPDPNAFTP